jgi:hypothetical protein
VDGRVKPGHDERKKPAGSSINLAALALGVCGRFNGARGQSQ